MNIAKNFLIGGTLSVLESTPLVGPFVIAPLRSTLNILSFIGRMSFATLATGAAVLTFGLFLARGGISILSSTGSGIYHLFAKTKKA